MSSCIASHDGDLICYNSTVILIKTPVEMMSVIYILLVNGSVIEPAGSTDCYNTKCFQCYWQF